jgi:hypothetical protein
MAQPQAGPHIGRSIGAVVAGSLVVVILSLGTDEILHLIHVYPPWGQPMYEPGLNALALGYRMVYAVLGNLLIYRLAPWRPMKHVWIAAGVGFVLSTLGAVAAVQHNLGPLWYPVALAFSAFPCAWVTGPIAQGLLRFRAVDPPCQHRQVSGTELGGDVDA